MSEFKTQMNFEVERFKNELFDIIERKVKLDMEQRYSDYESRIDGIRTEVAVIRDDTHALSEQLSGVVDDIDIMGLPWD